MRARSRAFSRCAEAGAAVITALLTVALVAGLASALVADYGAGLESLAGRHDQAQARWLARGAVDWARNVLADDRRTDPRVDHLGEPWAVRVPPTPVEEGEVGGELQEQSGRFNLNNLAPGGHADEAQIEVFERLMAAVGIGPGEAREVAEQLADWIDADSLSRQSGGDEASAFAALDPAARPPDAQLAHPDELARLPGVSRALADRLRPFVTAVLAPSTVNVNTASPELLHALLPDLSVDAARVLVAERERAWFKDMADFRARLPENIGRETLAPASTRSDDFLATGRARYGQSVVRMEVLLHRGNKNWPDIVWQRIL